MGCYDEIKKVASDILGFIENKTGVKYDPATGEGKEAFLKAVKDFKNETVNDLKSIYEQIKNKENAIQVRSTEEIPLAKTPGSSQKVGGGIPKSGETTNAQIGGKPPTTETKDETTGEEKNTVGIHHEALGKLAKKLGLEEPERGVVYTPEEYAKRGQLLIDNGADPVKIAEDFENDGKVNADIISVAKAHLVNLVKAADKARTDFGGKSPEYNKALKEVKDWSENVAKPMGTKFGEIGRALQGETDLDTGSFVSVSRAVEDQTNKPLTPKQSQAVEALTNKVKEQNKIIEDLHKQFAENIEKQINEEHKQKNINKAKKIIDGNKKVKDAETDLIFQSAKRDYVAARVAKAIDKGETIDKAVDDIASEGLIKPENVDAAKKYFNDLAGEKTEPLTSEEKNIKRLEKQLSDLKEGIKKTKPEEREKSQKEIDLENEIQIEKDKQLALSFADKRGNKFTPEEVKGIWEYAKRKYIDEGRTVNETIRGVSADLGLSSEQVLKALEQPQGSKIISDKMFVQQNRRNQVKNKVKEYVQTITTPKWIKWLKAIPNFFFQKAIFGHGTVGMITHAGMNISDPAIAKIYWPNVINQFKNSFGSLSEKGLAQYEKNMEHLKNNPLFITAKRVGVKVDPTETSDDYQGLKKWLGKVGMMGDRGFNALKQFRMAYFEHEYNKLSNVEKADPETLKNIAKLINHGTGTSDFNPSPAVRTLLFAPRLVASQWARAVTDPAKAIVTFSNWGDASLADRVSAKIEAKKVGRVLATYATALAVNQALLYTTGSNQSINFFDPTKKDWLKFKVGDEIIDFSGGIIPTLQFIGHLLYLPFESRQELGTKEHRSRIDALVKVTTDYGFGKMSPFGGTVKDIVTAHDYKGNTMPWSDDKPKNRYAHKMGWKEYFLSEQTPIPVAEASKDIYQSMQDSGLPEAKINDILTGIFKGVISGGTGVKVMSDYTTEIGKGGGGGATGGFHQPKQPTQIKQPTVR